MRMHRRDEIGRRKWPVPSGMTSIRPRLPLVSRCRFVDVGGGVSHRTHMESDGARRGIIQWSRFP